MILHVLPGMNPAGVEMLALQIITFSRKDRRNELLNIDSHAQAMAPAFRALLADGRISQIHEWGSCDRARLFWRSFWLCIQRRPDALLIYPCSRPMLWLALGARLAGVRQLAVHIGNTAPADYRALRTWHRLLLWFQRIGVIAVPCSQAIVDSLHPFPVGLRLGPVIPNGCDVRFIAQAAAASRDFRPPGDVRRVLMVARLDPIKDQTTLLRAFAAARQPGWQLQLVGDGTNRARLEALAAELGLDPVQVFLGRRSDIPELLGQADLFAFSTTPSEGFGIALIEAMAAGIPVIASDVPACREVLKNGLAGDLVAAGEHKAWSDSLRKLMTDASSRHALAAKAQAHAGSYGILNTADKWYQLLKQ